MPCFIKRQGRRCVIVDAAGALLSGPLSFEEAQGRQRAIEMAEHARRANDPKVLKQRHDKAAYRRAERDPVLFTLKQLLPRGDRTAAEKGKGKVSGDGKIERRTRASYERMLTWMDAQVAVASSDPQIHKKLNQTPGQRRTLKAATARARRGASTEAQVLALALEGARQVDIAKKLGLTPEWVCKILKRAKA